MSEISNLSKMDPPNHLDRLIKVVTHYTINRLNLREDCPEQCKPCLDRGEISKWKIVQVILILLLVCTVPLISVQHSERQTMT